LDPSNVMNVKDINQNTIFHKLAFHHRIKMLQILISHLKSNGDDDEQIGIKCKSADWEYWRLYWDCIEDYGTLYWRFCRNTVVADDHRLLQYYDRNFNTMSHNLQYNFDCHCIPIKLQ
jgi:hypothetical protein